MACDFCDRTRAAMWNEMKAFWAKPFSADMSATDWFLFIGLLIVLVAIWNIILYNIREAMN